MKKYLLLFPDTFLWYSKNMGLLYNSKRGVSYSFFLNDRILKLCEELLDPPQLYKCIILDSKDILLTEWLNKILELDMGELVQIKDSYSPISFPPILNLQSDVVRLESTLGRHVGENILSYITDINIYLGGVCDTNENYYKQFLYPVSDENILSPSVLKENIIALKRFHVKLNILGGDLIKYPYYEDLFHLIENSSFFLSFYVFDYLFVSLYEILADKDNINFKIIYTNYNSFVSVIGFIDKKTKMDSEIKFSYSWIYLVSSDSDIGDLDIVISTQKSREVEILPVYIESNISFFEKNVYVTNSFLLKPGVSKKYIYRNSVINSNFWGKITIMSDGKIYSNPNLPSIGNVYDSVYEILIREIKMKNSWRLMRMDCIPCKDCLYKYICPPISNYELVLKRYNLCFKSI